MMSMSSKANMNKVGYMCGTDFTLDLCDDNAQHVEVYGSIAALKAEKDCWKECGIVKLRIEQVEYVEPGVPYSERKG
jgi:hypothetical protein